TVAWTLRDRTPPPWDPSDHIRYAYDYARLLGRGELKEFARDFFVAPHFYAPLVHLVSAVLILIFGASRLSGIGVNLISLAVLMWSVIRLVDYLRSSPKASSPEVSPADSSSLTGSLPEASLRKADPDADRGKASSIDAAAILAVMIAACTHFDAWLLHDAFLDFPLIAAVAAGFAFLVRAGGFFSTRKAIQFGLVAGLGMLVKQTFAFFF